MLTIREARREDARRIAEIYAIYVDPAAWRRGAGRLLMDEAGARFRKEGYSRVTLWVLAENAAGRRFYAALGFTEDVSARKMIEHGGRELIELRYTRELVEM